MTREEAIAAGMEVHEIQHSMKRRTPWHDYSRKGTYMLTLVVRERVPLFGLLKGGMNDDVAPYVEYSNLGTSIEQEEIQKIHHFYPQVDVWKLCIMPDHLHMIVRVNEEMGEGKHLGYVVRGFKAGCTKAWWRLTGVETPGTVASGGITVPEVSTSAERHALFEEGYCDKILMHEGQLDKWNRYLDDNPRRLLLKRLHPELFTVLTGLEVAGEPCQVVGNRFLLDIPDKMAVIVHRRYTDEENARLCRRSL